MREKTIALVTSTDVRPEGRLAIANWLKQQGFSATVTHGRLTEEQVKALYDPERDGNLDAFVAGLCGDNVVVCRIEGEDAIFAFADRADMGSSISLAPGPALYFWAAPGSQEQFETFYRTIGDPDAGDPEPV